MLAKSMLCRCPTQQVSLPLLHQPSHRQSALVVTKASRKAAKASTSSRQKGGQPQQQQQQQQLLQQQNVSSSTPQSSASPTAAAPPSPPQASTSSPSPSPSISSPPPSTPSPSRNPQARQETPQVVVDRIFSRMVACAFLPVFFGILMLIGFYFLKKHFGDDFPLWPAYVSQVISFGGGLLGISYGALSASWDPNRSGSLGGWTEFQANLPILLQLTKDKR